MPNNSMEEAISDCHHVFQMSRSEGWQVIKGVLDQTLETYSQMWMTMNKERPEFDELRIEALACRKMIDLVESFDTQRKKLEEHWLKVNNPEFQVAMDMDNESGLSEK
jgi:hypothetical protein